MDGRSSRGNRETPATPSPVGGVGRLGKVVDRTPNTHVAGESDGLIVPRKQANKTGPTAVAESVEGRGPAKGNTRRAVLAPDSEPGQRGIDLSGVRQSKVLIRHHPRQEPYEVVPHVRICAGGGPQGPSLPRLQIINGPVPVFGPGGSRRSFEQSRWHSESGSNQYQHH
jgi:hypothetical protein